MSRKIKRPKEGPKKQAKHKNVRYADKVEIITYLPMIIAFGYIPLIVRGYVYDIPPILAEQPWMSAGSLIDFFLAYKSFAIIAMGVCAIIMVLASLPQKPFRKDRIFIPLCVYAGMALLSAIISPWRYLAFAGSMEMFESVLVIVLGYIPICIATYHFVSYDGMKGIKVLLYGALPGVFILLFISLFQFLKMDIFRTEFGKRLIAGQDLLDQMGDITFNFQEGTAYATLYNTNFVGFYTAIVASLFFGLIFGAPKMWQKVICFIGLILSIVCMYASRTSTAWLVLVFMVAVGALVWAFKKKRRGFIILGCEVLIGIMGIVAIASDTDIGTRARKTLGVGAENNSEYIIKSIDTNDEGIDFTLNNGGVHIEYTTTETGIELICTDEEGNSLEINPEDEAGTAYTVILPEGYGQEKSTVKYVDSETPYIVVYLGKGYYGYDIGWKFAKDDDSYMFVTTEGKTIKFPDSLKYADVFPYHLMTGRGSIWNYTIPMLPRHILLGSGANTYIMEYPQEDYLTEKMGTHSLDVKPHSFYLQQWVENGLIGMIGLLVFIGWYIYRTLRLLYTNSWKDGRMMISLGCLLGVCGWLFAGVANDSNVCTSLPLWCVLAVGFAINEFMIEEQNQKKN